MLLFEPTNHHELTKTNNTRSKSDLQRQWGRTTSDHYDSLSMGRVVVQ